MIPDAETGYADGGSSYNAQMSQHVQFSESRSVGADGIPDLGGHRDRVRLLRTARVDQDTLRSIGAHRAGGAWWLEKCPGFPFDEAMDFLPRFARRSIVPEVVDLIPSSSWLASLANLLSRSSWDDLRGPLVRHHGACQDCGDDRRLEAHEAWSYDDDAKVQSLDGVLILCRACHETRHLGRARIVGRFDQAFGRLCTVNRIEAHERSAYLKLVSSRWRERSRHAWQLRLPIPEGMVLRLKPSVRHEGDGWLVMPPSGDRMGAETRVVDIGIGEEDDGLVLVGLSREQLKAAYASSSPSCNSSR